MAHPHLTPTAPVWRLEAGAIVCDGATQAGEAYLGGELMWRCDYTCVILDGLVQNLSVYWRLPIVSARSIASQHWMADPWCRAEG